MSYLILGIESFPGQSKILAAALSSHICLQCLTLKILFLCCQFVYSLSLSREVMAFTVNIIMTKFYFFDLSFLKIMNPQETPLRADSWNWAPSFSTVNSLNSPAGTAAVFIAVSKQEGKPGELNKIYVRHSPKNSRKSTFQIRKHCQTINSFIKLKRKE